MRTGRTSVKLVYHIPSAHDEDEDEDEDEEKKLKNVHMTVLCSLTPGKVCASSSSMREIRVETCFLYRLSRRLLMWFLSKMSSTFSSFLAKSASLDHFRLPLLNFRLFL